MKKLFKNVIFFTLPVLIISFFIYSYKVISLDFKFAHQTSMVYQMPFSWQKYLVFSEIKRFKNKIFQNQNFQNISRVDFYISEQNQRKLLNKTPNSTKKWVNAQLINSNSELQEVELRYRGDNPGNWLKFKKTFRIKTKKNELIEGFRRLDYYTLKAEQFLAYIISEKMGLLSQSAKIVDVYMNGESHGLYLRHEKMDELFLRKNKIMPVNLYKGSNNSVGSHVGLNPNLFNNPEMWSKLAIFNQQNVNDKNDLKQFFSALNNNKSDISLNGYIDVDYFSKFEAYLTLIQNNHHYWKDNMRLIVDPWNGYVTQIITDPLIGKREKYHIDFSTNDLNSFLNKNTEFIHKKYNWIYFFIKEKRIVKDITNYVSKINDDLIKAEKKEPFSNSIKLTDSFKLEMEELLRNESKILKLLETNTKSVWKNNNYGFQIINDDITPLSNLNVHFKKLNAPEWIGLDLNYDNQISKNEPKFYKKKEDIIELPIIAYANRIKKTQKQKFMDHDLKMDYAKTKFNFITDNRGKPIKIVSTNFFTKKKFEVIKDKQLSGVYMNKYNKVIFDNELKKTNDIILSRKIDVSEDLIFNSPVIIKPGTIFTIKPGKNIIFKNKLIAKGTKENPITFKKFDGKENHWGSVAILGKKTKDSLIEHVNFIGGSGGNFNQYKFTSMLSIHNTKNIKILNSNFSSNNIYDDTIHVIYSNNITFENIQIKDAFSDAVDIDISKNIIINNIVIDSPKNDGIDLMESNAKIINAKISNSNDKAISVGENSEVEIFKSEFENNNIGIAVKDASRTIIQNSIIKDNKVQIAAYAKNWQYGKGGNVDIINSTISSKQNNFTTESEPGEENSKLNKDLVQNSQIKVFNTKIDGVVNIKGKNFFREN